MSDTTDIFISGAGLAGMILAARLAERGYHVVICDPSTPPKNAEAEGSDLRSTAYLEPSRRVMEDAGIWDALAPHATPLKALRVIDTHDWPPVERTRRTFHPTDLEIDSFGQNIPNWRAHLALMDHLRGLDRVDLRLGVGYGGHIARDDAVMVTLGDGSQVRARLLVGADGRNSPVRDSSGIAVRTTRYGQKAFAFAVGHEVAHHDISTEIYNSGGAFTTVPLADHDGAPASAIVWMNDAGRSREISGLDDGAFKDVLNTRSCGILGAMHPVTPIRTWPIITQTAKSLSAKRTILIAEAAHVLPPIGAQGLNTSIADIAVLSDMLGDDPGAEDTISRYARDRSRDMILRAGAIDLFNRVCQSDNAFVQGMRSAGLIAFHGFAPLRKRVMQAGMGSAA